MGFKIKRSSDAFQRCVATMSAWCTCVTVCLFKTLVSSNAGSHNVSGQTLIASKPTGPDRQPACLARHQRTQQPVDSDYPRRRAKVVPAARRYHCAPRSPGQCSPVDCHVRIWQRRRPTVLPVLISARRNWKIVAEKIGNRTEKGWGGQIIINRYRHAVTLKVALISLNSTWL